MRQVVICIVPVESRAEKIVGMLKSAGFEHADISLLMPDQPAVRDLAHGGAGKTPPAMTDPAAGTATAGPPVAGALAWLTGVRTTTLSGVGPVVAVGPILTAFSGSSANAPIGDLAGGLVGLGVPEFEAKQYEAKLRNRNILISVHTESPDETKRVEEIYATAAARDISRTGEQPVRVRK